MMGSPRESPCSPFVIAEASIKYSLKTTFTYGRALQGRRIRLLKVIPDPYSNILAIRLVEENLDEAKFEALSYVWGNTAERETIECNGRRFDIGTNLHAALQERRCRESSMHLWADQICINQSDDEEKTHQVRMMRDIYARADQVIVWLGSQQPQDIVGFGLANDLYDKCNGKQYDYREGIYDFHDFDYNSKGVPKPSLNPTWTALFKILGNPWFGRVWVIQEILVAVRSMIWKGSLNMDTNVMLWSAMLVGRHRNLYENFDITMGSPRNSALMARNIAASYFEFKKRGPLPIYDMLSRHCGMGATDPRDRFFALAGVSSGLTKAFVNYKKTFQEVACLVGKITLLGFPRYELTTDGVEVAILEQHPKEHRFLIEWLAFNANPQTRNLGLPSWVPDLLSPHSPGLVLTGFYNTLYLQEWRDIPHPQVRMKEQLHNICERTSNQWKVAIPKVSRMLP
jgi:hypothetical protein